ncbi:BET1-like protein isoform X3 [Corapipo altera]|uniref:BET1-like protein isoform X3 n=1 Tax=Corapipo altera TaxID=415028 RepID=UPI000FD6B2EC|nr:BET1-like protein isoform X3 [Corapipo altera]
MPRGWGGGDPLRFWGDAVSQWTTAHIPLFHTSWPAPPLATSFPRHLGTFQPPFFNAHKPLFLSQAPNSAPKPFLSPPRPRFSPVPGQGSGRTCGPGSLGGQRRPFLPFHPGPGEAARGSRCRGEGGGGGGRSGGHFVAAPPGGAGRSGAAMAERGRGQSPSAMEDLLDVENKRMADSLASKVTRLKSRFSVHDKLLNCPFPPLCLQLALDIDKDAEEQNRYLDGMLAGAASPCLGLVSGTCRADVGQHTWEMPVEVPPRWD